MERERSIFKKKLLEEDEDEDDSEDAFLDEFDEDEE
jgi:hypothetical protein